MRTTLAGLIVASLLLCCRHGLEADMARHMLIEFPCLLAAGAALGWASRGAIARWNLRGLLGFAFLSLTLGYWMIPAALDASVGNGWAAAAKWLTLLASGALLPASARAAPLPIQGFMLGNVVWMTATAGLVYQSADRQLCLYYLADAQVVAGQGLVVAAAVIGVAWCIWAGRRVSLF